MPFFTTIPMVVSLKNNPILSGRLIQSFRHLKLQNPSIISDYRHISWMCKNSGIVACKNSGEGAGAAAGGGGGAGVHLACRIGL